MQVIELVMFAFGIVVSVLFWMLRTRDEARARAIRVLFEKHDSDVERLQELKLMIAGKHYERGELDVKFERLEDTFKEGFNGLGDRFDKLSAALIDHIAKTK
jgi:hypothetical protein